ncbi:MAG: HEAT repeat domain-containing protein [Planctomycetota bacterium]|jgi:HEAT repeat protein
MKRLLPVLLLSAFVIAVVLPAGSATAESENWTDQLKEFKAKFKTKNAFSERRSAVAALAKVADGRAVAELLKAMKTQERYAEKLRKEWQAEEDAWREKTERLEKRVEERRERARERGEDTISVNDEEAEWLGAQGREGKMYAEKRRIEQLYKNVLEEEKLVEYILRSVARVLNSVEGEERTRAARKAASEAQKAKADRKPMFIRMFAFVKGEAATDALIDFAGETKPEIVIAALEALGRQNTERGMNVLIERLEDPRWQIRAAAIQGLSFYHDARAVDALIARVKKEEGVLQRHFFTALARIVQEQVPGTVEAWDSWWTANKEDMIERWKRLPQGEPIEGDPPDIPVDTSLGSTSFYGIRTNSKHIIFVVDVSGSMGEQGGKNEQGLERIDVARKELKAAINTLTAEDEDDMGAASFNIVIFSTYIEVYKPGKMVVATRKAKEKAMDWIDEKVVATSQTNIFDAVEQAFNVISATSDSRNLSKGADTMFLMTDGFPNRGRFSDPELILVEVKQMNRTRKITIHTIGVGDNHHAPFLRQLAAQNNGQYIAR